VSKFKRAILSLSIVAALLFITSCAAVPGFKIEIISIKTTSTGTLQGVAVTFRATFDNADSYIWDFGDGGTGSGQVAIHTYSQEGIFTVRLEIIDGSRSFVFSEVVEINANLAAPAPSLLPRAYVLNVGDNAVGVLDTDSNVNLGITIPVGNVNTGGSLAIPYMAISPDGRRAYVVSPANNNNFVSVLDLTTNTNLVTNIPVGNNPRCIAVNPSGTRAYVCNFDDDDISVLDLTTNTNLNTDIPVNNQPSSIAVNPSGTRAYVTNTGGRFSVNGGESVSVLNLITNTNLNTDISYAAPGANPVPRHATSIALSPNGNRAYVPISTGSDALKVIVLDLVTNTNLTSIPIPDVGFDIAVSPDGTRAYVTSGGLSDVYVLDLVSNLTLSTIPVSGGGTHPNGIAVSADGTRAYVAITPTSAVAVLDLTTNTNLNIDIPVGDKPYTIVLNP
jgi:YVTN family beta-propeller protein